MKLRKSQGILALGLLLAGCASPSPKLQATDPVLMSDAYVYGRFKMTAPEGPYSEDGHLNVALLLECSDGSKYTLLFSKAKPTYAIRVKPADCNLTKVMFLGTMLSMEKEKPLRVSLGTLQAEHAYYLGDFDAEATAYFQAPYTDVVRWMMRPPLDNFVKTTQEFRTQLPQLSGVLAENLLSKAFASK